MTTAAEWLERIRALPLPPSIKVMNVCGGHERSITTAGLRKAIPSNIELVPGPGCPVCICPEEDIYEAIQLALHEGVILVAYGDMLRVPVNAPKSEPRSLEQAKAAGADVRPIASPLEAASIARENPARKVVFLAAGFETTTAPAAALLAQGAPANLLFLMSGRRTWPAVELLLGSGRAGLRGTDRARARGDGDGSRGMGVRAARSRHADRRRGLRAGLAARRAVFGAAAEARGPVLPRQLLSAGRAAGRQRHGAALHRRDDGHQRRQLARHRADPAVGLRAQAAATRRTTRACSCLRTPRWRASAPARCRRAATAPGSCSAASIRTNAGSTGRVHAAPSDRPVHGVRRRRLPHLVGRWRARERLGRAQGSGADGAA